ncbi:MAG: sugar phosphate nucleotidyltransferase [Candidatus Daviesbacteria bacterium]|nr:sugar phosphate nucleotidyltransferase [Candidatus Daviesbacteria bacterium]
MNSEVEAINYIMAGGEGRRLYPLTAGNKPKSLLPIGESMRCIDFTLDSTEKSGFLSIIAGYYGFAHLQEYVCKDNDHSILIKDSKLLGFGSLIEHLGILCQATTKNIFITPADHVHFLDYQKMLAFHTGNQAKATIVAIKPTDDPNHRMWVEKSGNISSYQGKPVEHAQQLHATGIYCFDIDFLIGVLKQRYITDKHFDITDVFRGLVKDKTAFAYLYNGHWRDIGTLDRYYEENIRISHREDRNVFVGNNYVADSASVANCVFLGKVSVGKNCHLKKAILTEEVEIPARVRLGFDRYEDEKRNIMITPKGIRVVSGGSSLL